MNEDQLRLIVEAAVARAVEDTKAQLEPIFNSRTEALAKKNAELLAEKKALQGKPEPAQGKPTPEPKTPKKETFAETLARIEAETDALLAEIETKDYAAEWQKDKATSQVRAGRAIDGLKIDLDDAVIFDRAHPKATDGSYYRQVKAAAEKRGVPMRVIDSREKSTAPAPIKRATFDLKATRYVASSEIEGQRMAFHKKAEREGKRVVVFKHPDQLPDEALAVYNAPDGK